jgi:hypothetical protein
MSQSGYTPILIYASGTTGNTPSATNLTSGASGAELALNYFDGKLFYKDASGNVQVLASKAGNINVSSLSFGTTGFTPSTSTTGAITVAGILVGSNGGTGVNNGSSTITLGGNLTTSGAYGTTLSVTNTTSVTLPTSGTLATLAGAETFTNKRIDPRVSSTTSASSVTPTIASYDIYAFTAQAATLTINAPTGTPVDGDKLIFRILDNGTPQTLSWNATYTIIGVTLPTTTTANKTTYVGCIYNANNTRWDVVAVTTQA